jgi:hypothetical protein
VPPFLPIIYSVYPTTGDLPRWCILLCLLAPYSRVKSCPHFMHTNSGLLILLAVSKFSLLLTFFCLRYLA